MPRLGQSLIEYRNIDGVRCRQCCRCKKWKSVNRDFYHNKRRDGSMRPGAYCCRCHNDVILASRNTQSKIYGYMPISEALWAITEIVNRVGKAEAARRIGVNKGTLWQWYQKDRRRIRRHTYAKILTTLVELREENVVRHRDSIRHGASKRGKPEKSPVTRREFYEQYTQTERDEDKRRKQRRRRIAC